MKTTQFKLFVRQPFTWPGMYPLFSIMDDGGCVCHKCAKENAKQIISSTRSESKDGWQCAGVDINWEDTSMTCDHCGDTIKSAYGDAS